ncbi:MAG: hydrolase, TatD family [Bacteroidetes bacterium]|jgi:TatD DNase family protein|nr:hydrolase, TatD family [Bacteroidota bacterium]
MLIDTHTHLYAEEFDTDRAEAVKRCLENNITKLYLPNVDSESIPRMLELEKQFPEHCFAMMGLHPCSVKENYKDELAIVQDWLSKRKFAAVGEIGIDLYWDKTFLKEQQEAFSQQINWALEHQLPIVIHCREAFDEIYEVLTGFTKLPPGIFHCFSGNKEQAEKIIGLGGFKLGIGGVLTFKNSGLDKVVEQIGLEHLVLETDSPYLAPIPQRGKRNESSYVKLIAEKLSQIKNVSTDEIAMVTSKNALEIFPV